MPIDLKRSRQTLLKLSRELTKLVGKRVPENVHKFRTHSRRVEALLSEVVLDHHRNDEKLLTLLAKLRKKAGRVRDLDVQIESLRNLKIAGGNGHKTQFMDALVEERRKREQKLANAFDRKTAEEVRKRLRRSAHDLKLPSDFEPLALTLKKLIELGNDGSPLSERTLHQYRIVGKRARYIAELSAEDPEATRVVKQLKYMQDVIGDWHDWLKLTQKAEKLLGSVRDSALVALLRNVTQAKFRQSVDAVASTRAGLIASDASLMSAQVKKSTSSQAARAAA